MGEVWLAEDTRDPDLAILHDHPEFIRMFGKA